jgi:hypothetical protein
LPDSGTTEVTENITDPDFPRVLSITGNAEGITGNVAIEGTNIDGGAITDTIALSGTSTVDGVKAFKTVTSITVPAKTNDSGDTVTVGTTVKLGLDKLLPNFSGGAIDSVLMAACDGTYETTRPTVAADADEIEKNFITFNTAPNGTRDLVVVFITAA